MNKSFYLPKIDLMDFEEAQDFTLQNFDLPWSTKSRKRNIQISKYDSNKYNQENGVKSIYLKPKPIIVKNESSKSLISSPFGLALKRKTASF